MNSEFIKFRELPFPGLTRIWLVESTRTDFTLGRIKWYGPWRKYCFYPDPNCIFDVNCLTAINEFIVARMNERKEAKAANADR